MAVTTTHRAGRIVPTPVGVNRRDLLYSLLVDHCPHTRGGEPKASPNSSPLNALSPHPWG